MARQIRIGYVGCGFMAQKVHIPNLLSLSDCKLVALAEVRSALGAKVRERYGIQKLYHDHKQLAADPEIDAVAVSGHYSAQCEIARELLLAGKDVFMEKPVCVCVAQGERLLEAERKSGRRAMVGHMKRYDAGNLLVKKLIDEFRQSGELGRIQYVRNHGFGGDWLAGLDTPFEKSDEPMPDAATAWPEWLPEQHRKGYLNYLQQYCHNLNLLRWFLGASGDVSVKAAEFSRENGFHGVVVLEIAGVRTVVESGWLQYEGWEEHTQIYFEKGWVKTDAPPLLLKNVPATVEVYRADKGQKSATEYFPENGRTWCYREELRHFIQCLQTGENFRTPAGDTLEDIRAIEAIFRVAVRATATA
jgi:predicted dehydrogenase